MAFLNGWNYLALNLEAKLTCDSALPNGESQFSVLPLPLSFARSHESKGCPNSGFDQGAGLRGRGKARQGKFIYIAHFIHSGNSKCFT